MNHEKATSVPSIPEKGESIEGLLIGDTIKIVSNNRTGDYSNKEILPTRSEINLLQEQQMLQVGTFYEVLDFFKIDQEIIGFILSKIPNPNIPSSNPNKYLSKILSIIPKPKFLITRKNLQNSIAKKI